ncbi:MAG: ribosome silencing factor [Pseudomonadota bacterium]
MTIQELKNFVIYQLDQLKAQDVLALDVRNLTCITDYMIIASATSSRHVQSVVDNLHQSLKMQGHQFRGCERDEDGEWTLLDCGDVVVHVMMPRTRDFYHLEALWQTEVDWAEEKCASNC